MTGLHRRRKRTTTTEQYARMLRRMITAYGPRIGEEPMVALSHLHELEDTLADAANLGIHLAIESGESPTELAAAWGTSRQTIYKRAELGAEVAKQRRAAGKLPATPTARPRELSGLLDGMFLTRS